MADIELVVQSDDIGMCHAVNEGFVKAYTEGILTQGTVMVPCPWFEEAVALAASHRIPLGIHLTLTSEFDRYRWRPLTDGRSLVEADGTFHRTRDAAVAADPVEAEAELDAQVNRLRDAGLDPAFLDSHMLA